MRHLGLMVLLLLVVGLGVWMYPPLHDFWAADRAFTQEAKRFEVAMGGGDRGTMSDALSKQVELNSETMDAHRETLRRMVIGLPLFFLGRGMVRFVESKVAPQ